MIRVFNKNIDILKRKAHKPFELSQGDELTNVLEIEIFRGEAPLSMEDKSVEILYITPNKSYVHQTNLDETLPLVLEGNKISAVIKNEALLQSGNVEAQLRIVSGDEVLYTQIFVLDVKRSLNNNHRLVKQDSFPILDKLIKDVKIIQEEFASNPPKDGPRGPQGIQGIQGKLPDISFRINALGELLYEVKEKE